MVANTGEKNGVGAIRALNTPQPVEVRESKSYPSALKIGNQWRTISEIQDIWHIEDEWWRPEPISRYYFTVALKDGATLTIFKDLTIGRWFKQSR